MAAHACGLRPRTYARTRTYRELAVDGRAVAARWTWPAQVIMGAISGGKSDGRGQRPQHDDGSAAPGVVNDVRKLPTWFKRSARRNYNVADLGPIYGEADLRWGKADRPQEAAAYGYAVQGLTGAAADMGRAHGSLAERFAPQLAQRAAAELARFRADQAQAGSGA